METGGPCPATGLAAAPRCEWSRHNAMCARRGKLYLAGLVGLMTPNIGFGLCR